MKIKSGFVSNSSTCSFVVVGWKTKLKLTELADIFGIPYKDEDDDDMYDDVHNHEFIHIYNEDRFIGIEIAEWMDDGYCEKAQFLLPDLIEKLTEITKISDIINLSPKSAGIFTGVYAC